MLIQIFLAFLKIGFLGFGGGYAMLSMVLDESLKLGLTLHQFADLNALDMLIPGPIAINAATYVGYLVDGFAGATVATAAVCVPSFVLVPLFIKFKRTFAHNPKVNQFLDMVKPAAVGLVASAGFTLLLGVVFGADTLSQLIANPHAPDIFALLVVAVCSYLHIKKNVNPILLTVVSGVVGFALYYVI